VPNLNATDKDAAGWVLQAGGEQRFKRAKQWVALGDVQHLSPRDEAASSWLLGFLYDLAVCCDKADTQLFP
jgi:hypothetical protein